MSIERTLVFSHFSFTLVPIAMKTFIKKALVAVLTFEARLILRKYQPYIIAVTGSVGKTSTKDAIFSVLSQSRFVRKSDKSLNSEFGVPLTIIGAKSGWNDPVAWLQVVIDGLSLIFLSHHYPRYLVLEVGADHPGDIKRIASWLKPNIAVITAIPDVPVHVEFFKSPKEVLTEKRALAEAVPMEGKIILDGDSPHTRGLLNDFRSRAMTYGTTDACDVFASHPEILVEDGMPAGMFFRINRGSTSVPTQMRGVLGRQQLTVAAAACAVALASEIDLLTAVESLKTHVPPPGRMRLIPGIKGSLIIDDTYNASPLAMHAALDTLKDIPVKATRAGGRKIAVLGDMLELGKYSGQEHKAVGEHVAKSAQALVTVGLRSRGIAEAARGAKMRADRIVEYGADQAAGAGLEVREMLKKGDIVLVKGSQSMRMERTVKELMADPSQAEAMLVRQDTEWLQR